LDFDIVNSSHTTLLLEFAKENISNTIFESLVLTFILTNFHKKVFYFSV